MGEKPSYKELASQFQALLEREAVPYEELKTLVGRHSAPADATAPDEGAKEKEAQVIGEMTLGGVALDVLSILKGKESYIEGVEMANRSKNWKSSAGKEDRQLVQDNAGDIPAEFADKVYVFCDERHPDGPDRVAVVNRVGDDWILFWDWLGNHFYGNCVFVRRKFPKKP